MFTDYRHCLRGAAPGQSARIFRRSDAGYDEEAALVSIVEDYFLFKDPSTTESFCLRRVLAWPAALWDGSRSNSAATDTA